MYNLSSDPRSLITDSSVIESFMVAIDCWSFLHSSNTYRGGT